jgi:DNA-binding transcriptional ArsR family regulator
MLTNNANQYAIDCDNAPRMSARVALIAELALRKDALLTRVPLDRRAAAELIAECGEHGCTNIANSIRRAVGEDLIVAEPKYNASHFQRIITAEKILEIIRSNPPRIKTMGIAVVLGVARSSICPTLKRLRDSGVITAEREGQTWFYGMTEKPPC